MFFLVNEKMGQEVSPYSVCPILPTVRYSLEYHMRIKIDAVLKVIK